MTRSFVAILIVAALAGFHAFAAVALAQEAVPAPDAGVATDAPPGPTTPPTPEPDPVPPPAPVPAQAARPPAPPPSTPQPYLLHSPSARLLPGAVLHTGAGVDTGGSLTSLFEVGLGDVADFGVQVVDLVRARQPDGEAGGLFPYVLALFKLGLAEHRLFAHQPAVALSFRKSFEHEHDGRRSRVAELSLLVAKSLGPKVTLHGGACFWDAVLASEGQELVLHDRGVRRQLRGFGGIELEAKPDAQIVIETFWMPRFDYGATPAEDRIRLEATLAWGVRYQVTPAIQLEAGVRVPEVEDANLLDAQIFGLFKLTTRALRRAIRLE